MFKKIANFFRKKKKLTPMSVISNLNEMNRHNQVNISHNLFDNVVLISVHRDKEVVYLGKGSIIDYKILLGEMVQNVTIISEGWNNYHIDTNSKSVHLKTGERDRCVVLNRHVLSKSLGIVNIECESHTNISLTGNAGNVSCFIEMMEDDVHNVIINDEVADVQVTYKDKGAVNVIDENHRLCGHTYNADILEYRNGTIKTLQCKAKHV